MGLTLGLLLSVAVRHGICHGRLQYMPRIVIVESRSALDTYLPALFSPRKATPATAQGHPAGRTYGPVYDPFCWLATGVGSVHAVLPNLYRKDRLLVTMALLRLGLLRKKVLMLVNSIDAGFRLRLFLETFGVRSAVLNAELPLNSRHHILQARAWPGQGGQCCLSHANLHRVFGT